MITQPLLNFIILVSLQLLFFIVHAWRVGEKDKISQYLVKGMTIGLPFGVIFDLIVGKYFGLFDYELGYVMWFLVINGIFSYGFMIANVFLLRKHSTIDMYLWSAGLGLTYEVINFFFPVWEFTFATPWIEYSTVILILYIGLVWLMMAALQYVYKIGFRLVPFGKFP